MLRNSEGLKDFDISENIDTAFTSRTIIKQKSHFSRIAKHYIDLRTKDADPITFINKKLQNINNIKGADIGCGCGRYTVELFQSLGDKLHLTCVDQNENMLRQTNTNLVENGLQDFKISKGPANDLRIGSNSLDFIVTFNAIHHFDLIGFLSEAARTLKDNRYLFVYTRFKSQNKRNIWGKLFPKFHEKETRLYELEDFKTGLLQVKSLTLESVNNFEYKRRACMEWLLRQALHHHYSTFDLYDGEEFEDAIKEFQKSLVKNFRDTNNILWTDENVMLVIRRNTR